MQIPKRILVLLAGVSIATMIGSMLAYQTARWALVGAQSNLKPPQETSTFLQFVQSKKPTNTSDDKFLPMQVGVVMTEEFGDQKLPPVLVVTTTDPDTAAQELAAKIAAEDEESGPALMAAFKFSGFNIQDKNGNALLGAKNTGQGIGFEASEVASMAKLYVDGLHITLSDLSDVFTQNMPGFKGIPFAKLLVAGFKADSESSKPELRFWSRFIVELGKHSNPPYDLTANGLDPATAQLNAIQFAFIMRRLAADLMIVGSNGVTKTEREGWRQQWAQRCAVEVGNARFGIPHREVRLIRSAWQPTTLGPYTPELLAEGGTPQNGPCNMTEGDMQVLDAAANSFGIGFDQLMEFLKNAETLTEGATNAIEKYGNFTMIANAIFTYAKLVMTFISAYATIQIDSSPLVRQIDEVPGCQRKLTAQVMQKAMSNNIINCLRTALNVATNIDLNLPTDGGPIKRTKTRWIIIKGGADVNEAAAAGYNTAIVEWNCHGRGDCTQPMTDENGKVDITIEGMRQRHSLEGWAVPDMKEARVQLEFAAKPIDLRQDLIDAGAAGGLIASNPMVLLATVPVEMILRSRWFASPVFSIPVKDWKPCKNGWTGTITYEYQRHYSRVGHFPDYFHNTIDTTTENQEETTKHVWELSGTESWDGEGSEKYDNNLLINAKWSGNIYSHGTHTESTNAQMNTEVTTSGGDSFATKVMISLFQGSSNTWTYKISVLNPVPAPPPNTKAVGTTGNYPGGRVYTSYTGLSMQNPGELEGTVDANDPMHFSGEKKYISPDPKTTDPRFIAGMPVEQTVIRWDLRPCGRVGDVCSQ